MAKLADNKATKGATNAVAWAAANGSALLAGLGVAPAATPQAPPQATTSPTAATAVPVMASPAAAVPAMAVPGAAAVPTNAVSPAATDPGRSAFERRTDASPPDVVAELDEDTQLKDQDAGPSVQQVDLQAVQSRLKEECGPIAVTQELKRHLVENDWWLRAVHAPKICKLLGIECFEPSNYRVTACGCQTSRWDR